MKITIKLTYVVIIVALALTVLLGYFVVDKIGWGNGTVPMY
jgi:hypothetical protein